MKGLDRNEGGTPKKRRRIVEDTSDQRCLVARTKAPMKCVKVAESLLYLESEYFLKSGRAGKHSAVSQLVS